MSLQVANEQITKGIKLETLSKEEAQKLYQKWNQGPYNFLLQRTLNNYNKSKTAQRRNRISASIQKDLPLLSDEVLLWLYQQAIKKHMKECQTKYQNSGYQDTPSERNFQKIIEKVIESDPKYSHLEVYPSLRHSKDLSANQKMTVGVLIPDFIIFGIKKRGCTSVAIEIDGDSHVYKYEKDMKKIKNLESLGIATLPIPNQNSKDEKHIKDALDDWLKKRSGALDLQIKRNKRKIWTKTVACQMTLGEIESSVKTKFSIDLNLTEEAKEIIKLKKCPRSIKRELLPILEV